MRQRKVWYKKNRLLHRRAQPGQGIFDFIKKVARNPLVKSVAQQGLKYAPAAYANLTKRVKNKTLKRILDSDMAHSTLKEQLEQQIIV